MTAIRKRVLLAIWIPTLLAMAAAGGLFASYSVHANYPPSGEHPLNQDPLDMYEWDWGLDNLLGGIDGTDPMDSLRPRLPPPEPIDRGGDEDIPGEIPDPEPVDLPIPAPPPPPPSGGN